MIVRVNRQVLYEFLSLEQGEAGRGDVLTVRRVAEPTWWGRLAGRATCYGIRRFGGSGTVWRSLADGRRCGTPLESILADLWDHGRWRSSRSPGPGDFVPPIVPPIAALPVPERSDLSGVTLGKLP
jgi:hypothetical protein